MFEAAQFIVFEELLFCIVENVLYQEKIDVRWDVSFVDSVSVICIFEVREDVIHELFGCADSIVELFVRYLKL